MTLSIAALRRGDPGKPVEMPRAKFLDTAKNFFGRPMLVALVPAISMTIAIPFYLGFVSTPTWQMALVYMAVPTLMTNAYLAPALAVVQSSVKPEQRTMSGALLLLVLNFVGLGFGPTFVGEMSTHFTETLGNNVIGLQTAMYWITPFYGVAVFFLCLEGYLLHRESTRDAALATTK